MLKTAAAMTAAPVALLTSTAAAMADAEHPETKAKRLAKELSLALDHYEDGDSHAIVYAKGTGKGIGFGRTFEVGEVDFVAPIKEAYDRYLAAYKVRFAEVNEDGDFCELSRTPEAAEYDIARYSFYACPCRSHDAVVEKIRLLEGSADMSEDITTAWITMDFDKNVEFSALSVFLRSLHGETIDVETMGANMRAHYAKLLPAEIQQQQKEDAERLERRQQADAREKEKAAREQRQMHPEQKRLTERFHQAVNDMLSWQAANPELAV